MGDDQRKPGSDLFIVDNSDVDWKVRNYLTEWCGLAKSIDIATARFDFVFGNASFACHVVR